MHLTLYTRPGCHLCDDLKETLVRVRRRQAFELTEVDISRDPALERRYEHDIPVLLINGAEAARHRIDEADLMRRLTRAQAGYATCAGHPRTRAQNGSGQATG